MGHYYRSICGLLDTQFQVRIFQFIIHSGLNKIQIWGQKHDFSILKRPVFDRRRPVYKYNFVKNVIKYIFWVEGESMHLVPLESS